MVRRKPTSYRRIIARKIKKGRGQGRGAEYVPWLKVQDGPSQGNLIRSLGWKTGRVHHFLSKLEYQYFCVLEWSSRVFDIREQYPLLPLDLTIEIADRLRIKHPTHPKTKQPIVLTSDFLIDLHGEDLSIQTVRTIKPYEKLDSKRIIEKFEIERTYWAEKGIDWGIVTELELIKCKPLYWNIDVLRRSWHLDKLPIHVVERLPDIEDVLYGKMSSGELPPVKCTVETDRYIGIKVGSSLTALKHLLAKKFWRVNMNRKLDFCLPMFVKRDRKWRQ